MTPHPKSKLYVLPKGTIYITRDAKKQKTRRHAATLLVSLCPQPIEVVVDGHTVGGQSVLVKPGALRWLSEAPPGILSINIDPWHPDFYRFRGWQQSSSAMALALDLDDVSGDLVNRCRAGRERIDDVLRLFDHCAHYATHQMPATQTVDQRVLSVIDRINRTEPDQCRFADLAHHAGVSENHLSHIFTDNVGISMRSLRLWHKLRLAMQQMIGGDTLTTIAHDCGFSDSAHFSRSFHRALGLKPSFVADPDNVELVVSG